jgi:hypothetical protein
VTPILDVAELMRRLHAARVEHVLIGGLAVNAHGVIRATQDADIDADHAYPTLARDAEQATAFGVQLRVCSLAALRQMKRAAGRPRDLLDLADLEAAHPEE